MDVVATMRKYTHFITASNFFKNSTVAKQQFIIDKMSRCARDTHSSHVFLYYQISRDFFLKQQQNTNNIKQRPIFLQKDQNKACRKKVLVTTTAMQPLSVCRVSLFSVIIINNVFRVFVVGGVESNPETFPLVSFFVQVIRFI